MTDAIKKRIQVQVNKTLADEGEAVLDRLGLIPTTAITMFYKRLVAEVGLPFSTKLTQREKDELEIEKITSRLPVEHMDTPDKIKEWLERDD